MKIPKQVKAFGRTYKIVRDTDTTSRMECWGFLDDMTDEIYMRPRSNEFTSGHERQVFLHELLHLIDTNFHIGISEEQVQLLAIGITHIIDENKLDFTDEK